MLASEFINFKLTQLNYTRVYTKLLAQKHLHKIQKHFYKIVKNILC